jgi:flagellar basal body-associated protein FliL
MPQKNFTPLNIKQGPVKPKQGKAGTIILIIAIITALVVAFILVLLIQKNNQMQKEENFTQQEPTTIITPTETPQISPEATNEAETTITQTKEATTPSQISPSE